MKPGEIRRFKASTTGSERARRYAGRAFMVVDVYPEMIFLIDDKLERGWGQAWIRNNSEVIDEAR